jgi:limonene-1,2-epoxide hydrolase
MENILTEFYTAFSKKDGDAMAACYHDEVVFEDPAFGKLYGKDAGDMWRMLCKNGKDLEVSFYDITADNAKGLAKWEAKYTFSKTGRKVHNIGVGTFRFKDGKIIEHRDIFNLYTWAKQAMGFKGLLLILFYCSFSNNDT